MNIVIYLYLAEEFFLFDIQIKNILEKNSHKLCDQLSVWLWIDPASDL